MKKIIDFLRKIGVLQISKGDYNTGEFDDRKDIQETELKSRNEMGKVVGDDPEKREF